MLRLENRSPARMFEGMRNSAPAEFLGELDGTLATLCVLVPPGIRRRSTEEMERTLTFWRAQREKLDAPSWQIAQDAAPDRRPVSVGIDPASGGSVVFGVFRQEGARDLPVAQDAAGAWTIERLELDESPATDCQLARVYARAPRATFSGAPPLEWLPKALASFVDVVRRGGQHGS